jgi:hypothetical protein
MPLSHNRLQCFALAGSGELMSMNINIAVARISRAVPQAESSLDDALMSMSSLMISMIEARKETGVSPSTGQAAIARLAKAQLSLVSVSSDVLRVHGELAELATAYVGIDSGMDLHEKCVSGHLTSEKPSQLTAVA